MSDVWFWLSVAVATFSVVVLVGKYFAGLSQWHAELKRYQLELEKYQQELERFDESSAASDGA